MNDMSLVMIGIFIATSLPFVVSILISLGPSLKIESAEEYFLSNRELDTGGFIAATIGYSLQVSSIFLFFYWGMIYGIFPIIMCATWAIGYAVLGYLIKTGKLDRFLGINEADEDNKRDIIDLVPTKTIHGFISSHLTEHNSLSPRVALLVISLASTIGIAGTMMTEIDYGTAFFLQAVGVDDTAGLVRYYTQISMLLFTTFYVLWGGFKAAVWTDRFQVPVAYVCLGAFTVLLCVNAQSKGQGFVAFYLLAATLCIYALLLVLRSRTLAQSGDPWSKATAYLTFTALFTFSLGAIFLHELPVRGEGLREFGDLLVPSFPTQFVLWGGISLLATNLLWQLIDVSSLQRIQAINKKNIKENRLLVSRVVLRTGIEAGLGWILIIICAFTLKLNGITDPSLIMEGLMQDVGWLPYLVPIFMLTVVVFMLSTVSGIISAIAYVAHFDISHALGLYLPSAKNHSPEEIKVTRFVTLVCVITIYVGYVLLRTLIRGDISTLLYVIWAFQLAITPSVLWVVFWKNIKLSSWVLISSTLLGLVTAWYVGTHPANKVLGIAISPEAWGMLPPLAVVSISCASFYLFAVANIVCNWLVSRLRSTSGVSS